MLKSLAKALPFLIFASLFAGAVAVVILAGVTPSYQARVTLLTNADSAPGAVPLEYQIQILHSPAFARAVADRLDLDSNPEYQPAAESGSLLARLSAIVGRLFDHARLPSGDRALDLYFENLEVTARPDSRAIIIGFTSVDPMFAARAADTIAAEYIRLRRDALSGRAPELSAAIADLRARIGQTEEAIKDHRTRNIELGADGQVTLALSRQRLSDLNAELTRVKSRRAEAEIRMAQIRTGLDTGSLTESPDIGGPPADRDLGAATEAQAMMDGLRAESARLRAREAEIERDLARLSDTIAVVDDAQSRLVELERQAAGERDLLQAYLLRYREALDRREQLSTPAEPTIISGASVPTAARFPRVIPIAAGVVLATFLTGSLVVLVRTRASSRAGGGASRAEPVPEAISSVKRQRPPSQPDGRQDAQADPTFATDVASQWQRALSRIAARIASEQRRFILMTHAEEPDAGNQQPAAVALARALARADQSTVLIDLRGDGASSAAMAIADDRPGMTDLVAGEACFAQVIARDRYSRTHFVPAGRTPRTVAALAGHSATVVLETLSQTYDHVVIDCGQDMIEVLAPRSDLSVVVGAFAEPESRERIKQTILAVSQSPVLDLTCEPAAPPAANIAAAAAEGRAA